MIKWHHLMSSPASTEAQIEFQIGLKLAKNQVFEDCAKDWEKCAKLIQMTALHPCTVG
jgi:hypothetical protein